MRRTIREVSLANTFSSFKDLDAAIRQTYLEIFTREPLADEVKDALSILTSAKTPLEGMADLRWAMLNSHEFKFLP